MQLPDVNVLVNAHREESAHHVVCRNWVEATGNGREAFGLSSVVCGSVLRIVTHRGIFNPPSTIAEGLTFIEGIRRRPNCVPIEPGSRHWDIFVELCRDADVRGNLVTDAYLAALAIESGSEWITLDGDFARFPGLRWRRPAV